MSKLIDALITRYKNGHDFQDFANLDLASLSDEEPEVLFYLTQVQQFIAHYPGGAFDEGSGIFQLSQIKQMSENRWNEPQAQRKLSFDPSLLGGQALVTARSIFEGKVKLVLKRSAEKDQGLFLVSTDESDNDSSSQDKSVQITLPEMHDLLKRNSELGLAFVFSTIQFVNDVLGPKQLKNPRGNKASLRFDVIVDDMDALSAIEQEHVAKKIVEITQMLTVLFKLQTDDPTVNVGAFIRYHRDILLKILGYSQ